MTSSAMPKTEPPSENTIISTGIISRSSAGRVVSAAVMRRIANSMVPVAWTTPNTPPIISRKAMISAPSRKPRMGAIISHCGPRWILSTCW